MKLTGDATQVLDPADGRLGVARTVGPVEGRTGDAVAWLLVEGGAGDLVVGNVTASVEGRADVFDGGGWSALIAQETSFAVRGDVRSTVVWRPTNRPVTTAIVPPSSVTVEQRGEGPNARTVRTYVGRGPLIAGETINQPGGWSSYPPHRHEHEEVYLYRFSPPQGFGVAVMYSESESGARVVHDGDVQRIDSGYHPVVAAPGYSMYYLWALAGTSDELTPEFDPVHAS